MNGISSECSFNEQTHSTSSTSHMGKENENIVITSAPTAADSNNFVVTSSKKGKTRKISTTAGTGQDISRFDNNTNHHASSKKTPTLIPRQRLAIPAKYGNNSNGNFCGSNELVLEVEATESFSSENKPLVQWDSDESEEELSFFPKPKQKSTLTDNMSVENMSLSGEEDDDEDDLHLTPPKAKYNSSCPCDPRLLLESRWLTNVTRTSSVTNSSSFNQNLDIKSCSIT